MIGLMILFTLFDNIKNAPQQLFMLLVLLGASAALKLFAITTLSWWLVFAPIWGSLLLLWAFLAFCFWIFGNAPEGEGID